MADGGFRLDPAGLHAAVEAAYRPVEGATGAGYLIRRSGPDPPAPP